MDWLKKQWSRKIAIGLLFWGIGSIMYILSVYKIFPSEIGFKDWTAFTEWIGGLMFVANVGDKAFAKPTGRLLDNDAPKTN